MNPTMKRCLFGLLGLLIAGASTKYPQYAAPLAFLGGKLFGTGASTVHDTGVVTLLGVDIGKKS